MIISSSPGTAPNPTTPSAAPAASGASDRPAPSKLTIPSLDDASLTAATALRQAASYVGLLTKAAESGSASYDTLVRRGFLESAITYAEYGQTVVGYDKVVDNDAFADLIDGAVVDSLNAAKRMSNGQLTSELFAELTAAADGATNVAAGLELIGTRDRD